MWILIIILIVNTDRFFVIWDDPTLKRGFMAFSALTLNGNRFNAAVINDRENDSQDRQLGDAHA